MSACEQTDPPTHYWLSRTAGYDVCQRRGCYWQRRGDADDQPPFEYRSARTEWSARAAEPACPGREVVGGAL